MNEHDIRILIVDDDEDDYIITSSALAEIEGWNVVTDWAASYDGARESIGTESYDVCLIDYRLGAYTGLELIRTAVEQGCKTPLILLTGQGDRTVDIEAMECGAADYLAKGQIDSLMLERSIRYSIQRRRSEESKASLENQLNQLQKMESIGRLAGGIAHEFNNLLTPIIGQTQLVLMSLPEHDKLQGGLEDVLKVCERAATLTRQLLNFSRGHQILEPKVINLNDTVFQLFVLLRRLIGEDIDLVMLPTPQSKAIKIDPSQIEQVLVNLVANARDAMPDGGQLTIETSETKTDQDLEYSVLTVKDTGFGMSEEVKEHIFEPFFTTKEVGKGTGLGLSSCYGIVDKCGGFITVETVSGEGTSFSVHFPTTNDPFTQPGTPEPRGNLQGGSETVLLVEDEPLVRNMVATLLSDQGFDVLEASDGFEALEMIAERATEEIHILLTDIVMPRMGGIELAKNFAELRPGTPILFMSGYTESQISDRSELGAPNGFVAKPFTPINLTAKIRELMDAQESPQLVTNTS